MSRSYDQLSIFGGNSNPGLTDEICDYLSLPRGRAEVFKFSNDNTFVRIGESVRENDVFVVQSFAQPVNDSIMELLIMIDTFRRASAGRITAVIPYFGYGRTDKKDQPRVPITARLMAELLQIAGADRVLTVDLHAGQVQGFFRIPVDELTATFPIADYFRAIELIDPVVVAADLGFAKRARNFANMIGGSVAFVEKRRLGNNSMSESLGVIGEVHGRTAIIVDDEIDTAGSICNAAEIVRREGAKDVLAACTHAVLSGPAVDRIRRSQISMLVTTDTCRIDPDKRMEKMRILPMALMLGEAISRIHTGGSVGALFGAQV
jgi:ribose-phosphate pyrophosphokinase